MTRAKRPARVPTVLSRDEVALLLACMDGRPWLPVSLLYGSGLRLMEALRLRVKDVDSSSNGITVRDGKGGKDRHTMLPRALADFLRREVERARQLHEADCERTSGRSGCRARWRASTLQRRASLAGNTCSRPRTVHAIRTMARNAGIISTTACWLAR